MRRGLLLLLGLTLVVTSTMGLIGQTQAHPVTVDGSTTEWTSFGDALSNGKTDDNTGHIIRNTLGQGEFFWKDKANDHRLDNTKTFTREVDLRDVRVTGDATNMYMYVSLGGTTNIGDIPPGNDLVELQVALSTDSTAANAQTHFAAPATSSLTVSKPWNRLLQTQFSSVKPGQGAKVSTVPLKVYNAATPTTSATPAGAISTISKNDNSIELSVPWTALGSSGPPSKPIAFTIVSLRDDGSAPSDGIATNILDSIGTGDAATDLADNNIDYSFQVNFASTGEVYSPLLISEVSLLPSTTSKTGGDSTLQWFELTNVSSSPVSVKDYKVGDAAHRGTSEGMFSLGNIATDLSANQSLVFVRGTTKDVNSRFKSTYNLTSANMKSVYVLTTTTTLSQITNYLLPSDWAGTDFGFSTTTASQFNDQVVLLDAANNVADLVEYSTTPNSTDHYPDYIPESIPFTGLTGNISVSTDTDIQRCPTTRSTNNLDTTTPDFVVTTVKTQHTPLTGCTFADVYATVSGAQTVQVQVQAAVTQDYTIAYGNNRQPASGVVVTDTLPTGMTYVANSTQGASEPTMSTDASGHAQLVWNVGAVATGATGQITFKTSVAASATAPTASQHNLSISASSASPEVQSDLLNNTFSLPVAYSTEPVINLAVTKTLNTSKSQLYSGGKLVYVIAYNNTGNKAATDVTLVDTFPAGLTYLSNSAGLTPSTPAAGQLQFNVVTTSGQPLAPNGSGSFEVTFAIPETMNEGDVVPANQVALSTSSTPEIDASNDTANSQTATLGARPPTADLVVTTSVQDASQATPGGTVVYTVNYSNVGQLSASSISLTDSFPSSLEYVSNSARLTADQSVAGQVKFGVVPMSPGDHASFQITFKVKNSATVGSTVQNQVTIATVSAEAPSSNNTATSEVTTIRAATVTETPTTGPTADKNHIYLPIVRKP